MCDYYPPSMVVQKLYLIMLEFKQECPFCGKNITFVSHLKRHIESVHGGKTFQCEYCEHKFTQKGSLNNHIQSIHEGKTIQCQYCNYKATQKGSLKRHSYF